MDGAFPALPFFPLPVPDQVWQEVMLQGSATQLLLGGVDGVGLPPSEAVSFPLPSGSSSRGGGLLTGEQRRQRLHDLDAVAFQMALQHQCGERLQEEQFAPYPLLIPFGWRPDPVVPQEKKAPPARENRRAGRGNGLTKVFIGGLPPVTTEEDLRAYFGTFGNVVSADILVDAETGKSRGFGFVNFDGPVPDGVLDVGHMIHGRACGTRIYDNAPNSYMGGGYNFSPWNRFDRYPKGRGKGEAGGDTGNGKFQGQRQLRRGNRRGNQPTQSRDDPVAQQEGQPAAQPAEQAAEQRAIKPGAADAPASESA
jgi:hypothetical protein